MYISIDFFFFSFFLHSIPSFFSLFMNLVIASTDVLFFLCDISVLGCDLLIKQGILGRVVQMLKSEKNSEIKLACTRAFSEFCKDLDRVITAFVFLYLYLLMTFLFPLFSILYFPSFSAFLSLFFNNYFSHFFVYNKKLEVKTDATV